MTSFPKRAVHLDFHTSPDVPGVGSKFDADRFAQTFVDARVDMVTVFAKCHHGHLYYNTDRPERHPALAPSLDLLREQVDSLHRVGIRAPIYLSVQCDEYAANLHPEWIALSDESKQIKHRGRETPGTFDAAWRVLDMSSPYQDFLADQLAEVLRLFTPVDGIFLDMCWDQPSCSRYAFDGMRKQGLDPADAGDRSRYARWVSLQYMERYTKLVNDAHADPKPAGIWFNSRPKANLFEEQKFLRHIEVECLPTGGWGYAYFPYVSRLVRNIKLPTLSHTGRFHRSWGDFGGIKPEAALMYECCSVLAQGMTSGVGDQLLPDGTVEPAAYDLIGKVYRHVESCEPFVEGLAPVADVSVIIDPALGDRPGIAGVGLVRMLVSLKQQFDLLPPFAELDPAVHRVVVVPEFAPMDEALALKLVRYTESGGRVVLSGGALLCEAPQALLDAAGIERPVMSPFTTTYLRVEPELAWGMPRTDAAVYTRGMQIRPIGEAYVLARVVKPFFERSYDRFCSHYQTPPDSLSDYAAVVEHGGFVTLATPLFTEFGEHAPPPVRQLFANVLDRLLPQPLVHVAGARHVEAQVCRGTGRIVVHLLSFLSTRAAPGLDLIEDPIPLVDVPVSIRCPGTPSRVQQQPEDLPLAHTFGSGIVHTRVSTHAGHTMVVIDHA